MVDHNGCFTLIRSVASCELKACTSYVCVCACVRVCSLTLLLLRKSPVVVHYLQHLQEFLQILSGEERHILDIVQADVCSVIILQHRNGVEWFCRLWHLPTTKVSVQFIGLFSCTAHVSAVALCLVWVSTDLSPRHSMTFARVMWKRVLHAWRSVASPAMPVHPHRWCWMSSSQLKAGACCFCSDVFFPIFLVDHLI